MVGKKSDKPRKKAEKFVPPSTFVEGVVALETIKTKERKTKIDYKGIKAMLEKKMPNGQTPVFFAKKSANGMSAIKMELEAKFPEFKEKLQLVKAESGQVGICIKPTVKA